MKKLSLNFIPLSVQSYLTLNILHHANGSDGKRSDFMPLDEPLETGKSICMKPGCSNSSDNKGFPKSI